MGHSVNIFLTIFGLFLCQLKVYAQSPKTFASEYNFNLVENGYSRAEKLFSLDSNVLQAPDKSATQVFRGVLFNNFIGEISRSNLTKYFAESLAQTENPNLIFEDSLSEKLYSAKINVTEFKLKENDETELQIPFEINELEGKFYYSTTSKGAIRRVFFYKNISGYAKKTLLNFISKFQVWKPILTPNSPTSSGQTIEDFPVGHAIVEYKFDLLKAKSEAQATKTILRFFKLKNEEDNNFLKSYYIPKGRVKIIYDNKKDIVKSISANEEITTMLGNKVAGVSNMNYNFQLKNITHNKNNFDANNPNSGGLTEFYDSHQSLVLCGLYTFIDSDEIIRIARKEVLADDNFESIKKKLDDKNYPQDSLYLKIRALATVVPESAFRLSELLDTQANNSVNYDVISRGLLHSQTPNSYNAIAQILLHHKDDFGWLYNLVTNLGLAKNPTDSLVESLKKVATETTNNKVRKMVQLALGSVVDNLSILDSAKSKGLLKWIFYELEKFADNEKSHIQKMLVLGNTNSYEGYNEVKKYLADSNANLRIAAINTICQFKNSENTELLLGTAQTDLSAGVRLAVAENLEHKIELTDDIITLKKLIISEKDTNTKVTFLHCFQQNEANKILIKKALNQIYELERNKKIKEEVLKILQGI